MEKERGHPKAAPKRSCTYYADVSAHAQRMRLLDALRCGAVTTIEARRDLDIMMPAARVHELRARGYNILTSWTTQESDAGKPHRIARYVLMAERAQGMGLIADLSSMDMIERWGLYGFLKRFCENES